jgi:DsbC/DsbD-like thiol-disulfide interchange protein
LNFRRDALGFTGNEEPMSTARTAVCALAAVVLSGVATAQGPGVARVNLASPWVELHAAARVRLLAGASAVKSTKAYLAGVEITLAEGWKTYWRTPGDAGVPPVFDWTGSTNLAAVKVRYPAPQRMQEPGAETIGYKSAVIFPVEVVPTDPSKPVGLALTAEFGVCRDICIPAEAKLSLALLPSQLEGDASPALVAAMERVPRQQASRRPSDPELRRVTASLDGNAPRLSIEARFPQGGRGGDVFVEAPKGLYVPLPKRLPDAADGTLRFEIDLSRGGNARELKAKTLTLTLVGETGATEATWTVP